MYFTWIFWHILAFLLHHSFGIDASINLSEEKIIFNLALYSINFYNNLKEQFCRHGGTGRRARFRSVWKQFLGGSNPLACTIMWKENVLGHSLFAYNINAKMTWTDRLRVLRKASWKLFNEKVWVFSGRRRRLILWNKISQVL